jgi:hypothetical protein
MPTPYRVIETYVYTGNDTILINGDVSFNLFFEHPNAKVINSLPRFQDSVKISFYTMSGYSFLPKLIDNTTVALTPKGLESIYKQQITLGNISQTISPGDNLLFSIEILPSNKTVTNYIKNHLNIDKKIALAQKIANILENRSKFPNVQSIGTALKTLLLGIEEVNITSEDFANVYNAIASSKFVYDSTSHPSSVTIPAKITEKDIRDYYLHSDQGMDEIRPTTDNNNGNVKLTTTPILWKSPQLERNKILKVDNITASIYLNKVDVFRLLNFMRSNISLTATLYDDNTTIATAYKRLDRPLLRFLTRSQNPLTFTFSGDDREITYGHQLGLSLSLNRDLKIQRLQLKCDQVAYPSSLRVKFSETNNIQIQDINTTTMDGTIIPGGSAQFVFNITSRKADTLEFRTIEREKTGDWEVFTPDAVTVSANSWVTIPVFVNSTNYYKEAYGDIISLVVVVSGNTGIARQSISAEVTTDAIQYKVEVLQYSQNINISKGENHNFYFVIKNNNTGAIDDVDSYTITASSKNHWSVIPLESIRNVKRGVSTRPDEARVVIQVPQETTLNSDVITITVTSDGDPSATETISVTAHVNEDDFLESIYSFFDSAAEQLGLNEIFGSDGAWILLILLVVVILFFCIILVLVITTKSIRIICTDRIKEIEATQKATYDVTLQNPNKKPQSYEIQAQPKTPSTKWTTTVEPPIITIDGRQTATVQVITTPTDEVTDKDWTEVTVSVNKTGRKKTDSITLLTMMKEGKTLLHLSNISHWPTIFNPGERVVTACSVSNNGTITARSVKVFFYLNGKQKNKLEVTIPPGNIADIQIPWIAEKGKNHVRIRVRE